MAAVAAAAQAGPVGPNPPPRRDPHDAGKWQKPKSERYVETQSGVGREGGIEEL